jgi:non-ribosomal peptide synthetase component F
MESGSRRRRNARSAAASRLPSSPVGAGGGSCGRCGRRCPGGDSEISPAAERIHELFEWQAARRPEALAVRGQGVTLSYGQLELRSNRLARALRRWGVGTETRVGLCVERSPEMVVVMLGILKAGGAYVPLDPSHPAARSALVLTDSAVTVLVTEERWLPGLGLAELGGRAAGSSAEEEGGAGPPRIVCLDREADRRKAADVPQ